MNLLQILFLVVNNKRSFLKYSIQANPRALVEWDLDPSVHLPLVQS